MQTGREPSRGYVLAAPRPPAAVPARPARPTLTLKGRVPAPASAGCSGADRGGHRRWSSPRAVPVEVVPTAEARAGRPGGGGCACQERFARSAPGHGAGCRALRARCPYASAGPQRPPRRADRRPHAALGDPCVPSRSVSALRSSPAAGPRWRQCLRASDPRLRPQLQLPHRGRPARIDALRPRRQPCRAGGEKDRRRHAAQLARSTERGPGSACRRLRAQRLPPALRRRVPPTMLRRRVHRGVEVQRGRPLRAAPYSPPAAALPEPAARFRPAGDGRLTRCTVLRLREP